MSAAEKVQYGQRMLFEVEAVLYEHRTDKAHVKYVKTTHHGNVLFMDDEVQLSTHDEHRYHEKLVHPVMKYILTKSNILILGGGDGCAAREVYKWDNVESVTVVDYDGAFVKKYGQGILANVNQSSLLSSRTKYVNQDAIEFLQEAKTKYDVVFIDFPDPDGPEMVSLYERAIRLLPNVIHPYSAVSMHIGPAIIGKRDDTFKNILIDTFKNSSRIVINEGTCYVPSFSNEWAFLYLVQTQYIRCAKKVELQCKYWRDSNDGGTVPADIA
jgi:spermidine synthase